MTTTELVAFLRRTARKVLLEAAAEDACAALHRPAYDAARRARPTTTEAHEEAVLLHPWAVESARRAVGLREEAAAFEEAADYIERTKILFERLLEKEGEK